MALLKAGSLLMFTEGEYSDYGVQDLGRVVLDIDLQVLESMFRANWKPVNDWDTEPQGKEFVTWLFSGGFVESAEYAEVHVGGYSDFKIEIEEKPRTITQIVQGDTK